MTVGELLADLTERSVHLLLDGEALRFRAPKGALTSELRDEIARRKPELIEALKRGGVPEFVRRPADRFKPFSLTDLQQAYLIGEADFYDFGSVAHLYQCYRVTELDFERFKRAVERVVQVHDVLRIVAPSVEEQRVLPELHYTPEYEDLRVLSPEDSLERVRRVADDSGSMLAQAAQGPAWTVRVQQTNGEWFVHFAVRLLAFDAVTLNSVYRDLAGYYDSDDYVPPLSGLSFRDYVIGIEAHRRSIAAERARGYWMKRLSELPQAPSLPRRRGGPAGRAPLERLTGKLSPELWERFRQNAKGLGYTVNAALCRVYADTLSRWSSPSDFSINLMSANRPPVDPDVGRVVGNCSTTTLVRVDNGGATFAERVAAMQRQIYADLAHSAISGVEVIRELERVRPGDGEPQMPVVFSSGVGLTGTGERFELTFPRSDWKLEQGRLSTPQVWLDHQVMEEGLELVYNWDYASQHFPSGMVQEMFEHYVSHLEALARDPAAWRISSHPLPGAQLLARETSNDTALELPSGTLYGMFQDAARRAPEAVALCVSEGELTYSDLESLAKAQRRRLEAAGIVAGDLVAVHVRKGAQQIAAVLGVLQLGASYLPLDSKTPKARVQTIMEHSCAKAIVVDAATAGGADDMGATVVHAVALHETGDRSELPATAVDRSSVAYVIYTSGSTGTPKGVVIDHAGAVNTIRDVNAKFGLRPSDKILGLSSLAFDLSVFDIFGAFDVGATLILPDEEASPNPARWLSAARTYGATVWNSVPALLEMAVEYCGPDFEKSALGSLRLVMLSGDWLPLPLVARWLAQCPQSRLVSLGGATEASIWSCFYELERLDPTWNSVPYGRPLANQTLHVLDAAGRECPDWVWGDLFIGGAGLMKGYHHDPEKSRDALVSVGDQRGVLYRTGDRARWTPDGAVEFGGREDNQVKLRGYRIELGEIENAMRAHPDVEAAVVVLTGARGMDQRLVGYVVPELDDSRLSQVAQTVRERLPAYMVPASLVGIDRVPLTGNGKVDRGSLATWAAEGRLTTAAQRKPATPTEQRLGALWMQVLGLADVGAEDDFFAVGGNSLLAVRLFNGIESEFGRRLRLVSLFEARTVAAQAKLLEGEHANIKHEVGAPTLLRPRGEGNDALIVLMHPVGGDVLCYESLVQRLPVACDVYGVRSPAIDGHRPVGRSMSELIAEYVDWIEPLAQGKRTFLVGWSMGGMLSLGSARALRERSVNVEHVYMIDSWRGVERPEPLGRDERLQTFVADLTWGASLEANVGRRQPVDVATAVERLREQQSFAGITQEQFATWFEVYEQHSLALEAYEPSSYSGAVTLFRAQRATGFRNLEPFGLRASTLLQKHSVIDLDADHYGVMEGAALARVCESIASNIQARPLISQ